MISFDFSEYCSGCSACANVCPVGAITMETNKEGFLEPIIDETHCLNCGKCDMVCPHCNKNAAQTLEDNICAVWLYASKDNNVKMKSSSGGACWELGKAMLEKGGYICGCVWNKNFKAVHAVGNSFVTLEATQGSKYVQSDIGYVYNEILNLLSAGNRVLFSGTPCQASAIHNIVLKYKGGKFRDQLLVVAIMCHGVASPKAWESYKTWTEKENGSSLVAVNFRDKSKEGYKKSYCRYEYANGRIIYQPTYLPSSKYIEATLVYNLAIRKSCSHCDCKGFNNGIDIIVGDYYKENQGRGRLGTSCVIAFTQRGKDYCEDNLEDLRTFSIDELLDDNKALVESIKFSPNRSRFLSSLNKNIWDNVEKLYPSKYRYKKFLVKTGLYNFVKKFI